MSCPNHLTPLIPERPLIWKGVPLFHVGGFSDNFSGEIYFVLGQGLGDHVNGFRIIHEIRKRFSMATCIVYADLRWEELVRRIEGIEIRWYPKAKDVLSKTGTNNPYDFAHETIRKKAIFSKGEVFLAYAHFPMPDRHARHETTLEATARAIGLRLEASARPFLPVLSSDLLWAENYLHKHGLSKGSYVIISPYSWPNKIWSKESFSRLIDLLREKLNLRTIVISYPEIGSFENEGVVCAFDLTLGQIAGLMRLSGLYIGLDSGPSHMAAFFDSPMVVIFVERRTIPFEVEPLSPQALHVVESFFSTEPVPGVKTVFDAASLIYKNRQSGMKLCPVCDIPMNYVVTSGNNMIRMMCSCGLSLDRVIEDSLDESFDEQFISQMESDNGFFNLERDFETLETFYRYDEEVNDLSKEKHDVRITTCLERRRKKIDFTSIGRLKFSIDSLIFWMKEKGYRATVFNIRNHECQVIFCKEWEKQAKSEWMWIPWGGILLYTTMERYQRWYSYARWGNVESLVGIVKSQSELGFEKIEMLACAWTAFRSNASFRSFRWVIKAFFMGLFR